MRAALALLVAAAGCQTDADYSGTEFLCSDGETCPPGFVCAGGRCLTPGDADAGVAADAAGADAGPAADDMVSVPEGEFEMGCDAIVNDCPDDAVPIHSVSLSAFEIDRTEVTGDDYAACVSAAACADAPGAAAGDRPATDVGWEQARAYCEWAGKRLPTEAEWELAARGTDGRRLYPWGTSPPRCARANFDDCAGDLLEVGAHPDGASAYGALDMAGNAAEWTADRYAEDYYGQSPAEDPPGPAEGDERVVRGGSFDSAPADLRGFARDREQPDDPDPEIGFRCAR